MGSDFAERYTRPSANATLILQAGLQTALQWALQGRRRALPGSECQRFFVLTSSVAFAGEGSIAPPMRARALKM